MCYNVAVNTTVLLISATLLMGACITNPPVPDPATTSHDPEGWDMEASDSSTGEGYGGSGMIDDIGSGPWSDESTSGESTSEGSSTGGLHDSSGSGDEVGWCQIVTTWTPGVHTCICDGELADPLDCGPCHMVGFGICQCGGQEAPLDWCPPCSLTTDGETEWCFCGLTEAPLDWCTG